VAGPECLTSGEQQQFCLGRRFSKHKMARYAKNSGGMDPLWLRLWALASTNLKALVYFSNLTREARKTLDELQTQGVP